MVATWRRGGGTGGSASGWDEGELETGSQRRLLSVLSVLMLCLCTQKWFRLSAVCVFYNNRKMCNVRKQRRLRHS